MLLIDILAQHNVATTALLANYWKNIAKNKQSWPSLCQTMGTRQQDLFKDPFMQYFVDTTIQLEAEQRLDKRMWLPLATRTRFFRRTVSDAVKNKGIKQVLILGSGFDTLPARKEKYTKDFAVKFFEIDHPSVLNCKEAIYKQHNINKNAVYIGLDYVQGDFIEELKKKGIDFTIPTLILWEGNTFYLEKTDVMKILHALNINFTKLIITFDYMHATMQTATQQLDKESNETCLEKTLTQFAKKNSPFKTFFAPNELLSLCIELGIECVNHKTASQIAREYNVDTTPYYTAETYSMITCERI